MAQRAPYARRPGRILARLLAPLLLIAVGTAVFLIVRSPTGLGGQTAAHSSRPVAAHRPPPYWTVRPGDTLAHISARTGVPVDLLEAYNPNVDPLALSAGTRLNLWQHPPRPARARAKPLGPMFWVVKSGESFGSIAASTGIDITTLEQLNPKLTPSAVQPGDRVRLRQ